VDVVYNAVPPLEPKPLDLGAHWPRARGVSFVVGCVGRLLAQKGQDTLLRAFAALRAEVPGALLMLVGDGPERARYESLAGELGVAEAVVFTGYETRAKEIIAALDALVLPARDEALGRVLIEAMALGVPVVGADHCGIPEVIDHEANGLLFPYGDAAVLAQTLSRLAGGAELRRALALAGRETAAGRFGIGRYVEALTGIIESAAAPGGARGPRG
jgi:glycosyltransferase involved in cell wall biosynthesis